MNAANDHMKLFQSRIENAKSITPLCEERPKSEFVFDEITEGVFAHKGQIVDTNAQTKGDASNAVFIIGEESILVIDTGGDYQTGTEIYWAIREASDLPISAVVLTHMHPDHVYGATVFEEMGVPIYGHPDLPEALASRAETYSENYLSLIGANPALEALPTTITPLSEDQEFDLGGRVIKTHSWQTAHTNNDVSLFDENSQTLFAGDLLFHEHIPALDGSLRGWQDVMKAFAGESAARIVPGHGEVNLPFPDGMTDQNRYFEVLASDTKDAIDAGERLNDAIQHIAESERDKWQLFESFNPRNATTAFGELEWE